MHDHRADLAFLLPDLRPGPAGVHRLVDAVARCDVAADVGLSGAHVDHVRVRLRHGNRSDRRDRLIVEDRAPGHTSVARFPHAAGRGGSVVRRGVAGDSHDPRDPSAGGRPDRPVLQRFEFNRRGRRRRRRRRLLHCGENGNEQRAGHGRREQAAEVGHLGHSIRAASGSEGTERTGTLTNGGTESTEDERRRLRWSPVRL